MRETHALLDEAQIAIREVRTTEGPAVRHLVAAAITLSEAVGHLTRERVWN